ncbi:MAG: hypothetical protein IPL26_09160 [Leptospiraceae bacterium]|nr:hypothetical protein [Leptospiraceae bacterium]
MTEPGFVPCYKTRDLQLLALLKFHLDEMEIPYFVTGEDFLFLENLAIPSHEAGAILYLLPDDLEKFQQLLEEGLI